MSRRKLSNLAGLSDSYVSKLEAGTIECSFNTFAVLAVILNLTQAEISLIVTTVADVRYDYIPCKNNPQEHS